MEEILIVLTADKPKAARDAHKKVEAKLESTGGRIQQRYGPDVLIVQASSDLIESLAAEQGVAGVYTGQVPPESAHGLDETGHLGIAAWNQRHSAAHQRSKQDRKGEGLAWDHPDFEPEGRPDE
jgi:hypothetical protein